MKKLLTFLFAAVCALNLVAQNNPGDTIVVQTFTFGSPQDAWFLFPSDTNRYEKIIMKYTLKCNPAQNPACGEWDYLTNTYVYDHTGLTDSSVVVQPTLMVNGNTPDSVAYSTQPTYAVDSSYQYFIVHTSTTSLDTAMIGAGAGSANYPFGALQPISKTQMIWRASELTAAGLLAGNITGLQWNILTNGSLMRNMTVRMKHTTEDSLSNSNYSGSGFTQVYSQNTQFMSAGWNSIQLTTPFTWDGVSNIIVEVTYDNTNSGVSYLVAADTTPFQSVLTFAHNDRAVAADPNGYITVPVSNELADIDSFITVAFWSFGDVAAQPQDGTTFEAIDSIGHRVLNVHGPWSNANVYWDAGNSGSGSYDRINKAATVSEYEGQWNYWTFTKNVATGQMKIYLNGVQWHSGSAMTRTMNGISHFRLLRGNWGGSLSYAGRADEFMVLNKVLTPAEIQNYMNNPITPSDTNYANLVMHFNFNDGNYVTAADDAAGNHADAVFTGVQNPLKPSSEITRNFNESSLRVQIGFEQGIYISYIDSVLVMDSILNTPYQILVFADSVNAPGVATDTIIGWPIVSNMAADSTIYQSSYNYFNYFPQVIRYEMARYITPYGNGLSLGNGWTWTFDVSDYVTLLSDSVHLAAGNWQELLDVKFLMILGTPPRDVIEIRNLWNGNFDYGFASNPIENHLVPLSVPVPANAANSRWKSRVTGHGMDTPQNCAEFCPKNHYYLVDNTLEYTQLVWRDNCDLNPLYPQGGTWVYDRSNWCPGAEVWTYDFELTAFVNPGDTTVLNHDVQPYTNTSGWDYYQIEDQVVFYSAPNFTLDASLEEILAPGKDQMWSRFNTICMEPVVRIKNTGSTTLTSLTITYGMIGGVPSVYQWTGNLDFMEDTVITLGNFQWVTGATDFNVTISAPNGGTDQYALNNSRTNVFPYPLVMPATFWIELRTNNNPWENSYTLKDENGNVVVSRSGLSATTTYRDTVTLPYGCYVFELNDSGEDGLNWWANTAQGTGYVRFRNTTSTQIIKSFNSDFGGQVYQQFTVGLTNSIDTVSSTAADVFNIYPNPSDGKVAFDLQMSQRKDATIQVCDLLGNVVYKKYYANQDSEVVEADLSFLSNGAYIVSLITEDGTQSQRMIIQ